MDRKRFDALARLPATTESRRATLGALLVTAIHDPQQVTGSDGIVHHEDNLDLSTIFTAPGPERR